MYCYAFLSIQGGGMYLMIRLPVNEFLMENRCVSIRLMAIAQHLKRKTYWEKATIRLPCTQTEYGSRTASSPVSGLLFLVCATSC
jgi:hypothetical protein